MVQQTQAEQMRPMRAENADQPMRDSSRQDIETLASLKSDIKWIKWILGIFVTLTIGSGIAAFFYIMQRFDTLETYILQRFDSIDLILLEIVQKPPP